jgi:hypothetical protein
MKSKNDFFAIDACESTVHRILLAAFMALLTGLQKTGRNNRTCSNCTISSITTLLDHSKA